MRPRCSLPPRRVGRYRKPPAERAGPGELSPTDPASFDGRLNDMRFVEADARQRRATQPLVDDHPVGARRRAIAPSTTRRWPALRHLLPAGVLRRGGLVLSGTISLTTYFHADEHELDVLGINSSCAPPTPTASTVATSTRAHRCGLGWRAAGNDRSDGLLQRLTGLHFACETSRRAVTKNRTNDGARRRHGGRRGCRHAARDRIHQATESPLSPTSDAKEWAAWRNIFIDYFVSDTAEAAGKVIEGADEFVAFMCKALGRPGQATATRWMARKSRSCWRRRARRGALQDVVRFGPGVTLVGYGHYHETYENISGQWLIESSKLTRLREDIVTPVFSLYVSDRIRRAIGRVANGLMGQ